MIGDVLPRERARFPCGWSGGLRSPSSEYGKDVFDSGKETLQAGFFTPQRAPPTHPTHLYQTFPLKGITIESLVKCVGCVGSPSRAGRSDRNDRRGSGFRIEP